MQFNDLPTDMQHEIINNLKEEDLVRYCITSGSKYTECMSYIKNNELKKLLNY